LPARGQPRHFAEAGNALWTRNSILDDRLTGGTAFLEKSHQDVMSKLLGGRQHVMYENVSKVTKAALGFHVD
jgi:hypothetical protein